MHSSPDPHSKHWPVLLVASVANVLTVVDLWAVNIAYPAFERAFAPATLSQVSWILSIYAILLAALLIPGGRLADIAGRKGAFLAGLALFGLASLGCALSTSLGALVAFRAVQGAAAAVLIPTSLGFAVSAFSGPAAQTAVGVWAAFGAIAASGGPIVGGLLVALSWRWIFLINVPLVAATIAVGLRFLPDHRERSRRRLDGLGAALVFGVMALVCTALVEATAWGAPKTWAALGLAALVAAALVVHSRRHPDPIIAPSLFAARRFRTGATGIFAYYVGFAGMLLGLTLLLTDAWHRSVLQAALDIAPGPIVAGALSPFSGRLTARLGLRTMVVAGAVLFAGTAGWPLFAATSIPDYGHAVLPALLLWGVANALLQPALFATADAAPPAELATGSAVLSMARQLGSALGVALLVAVLGAKGAGTGLGDLRRVFAVVVGTAVAVGVTGLRAPGAAGRGQRALTRSPREASATLG